MLLPPDSYRITDGLLAGGYPGALDPAEAMRRLRVFSRHGVTLFVDLTHPADPLPPYERWLGTGALRVSHPIVDMGTTTVPHMTRILDEVDETIAAGRSVYVHCWGGRGRTGTVVGCWLMRHGFDQGDAIAQIAALRRELPDAALASPETAAQCAMVTAWKPGH